MKKACVIGWPIKHSRSPLIHGHWLAEHAIDGNYTKEAVAPEHLETFLRQMADNGFEGCNVTLPHKERVYALSDEQDESAQAVLAANTVWFDDGRICVSNTDTEGFMTHLATSAPNWQRRDALVAILGAGGAARAIVYGFMKAGVSEVQIMNRTREKAEKLVDEFSRLESSSAHTSLTVSDWAHRQDICCNAAVVVNTTTLGMNKEGDLELAPERFADRTAVADIVYSPLETKLLKTARAAGHDVVDGLGMLLHQAVPGFEKWFGIRPKVTTELRDLVVADLESH